jgi:cytochrome c oxidase subunit 3
MSDAHEHHEPKDDGHGHGHGSPFIQHHYDDAKHQFDSGKLGVWFFLTQEILFFSALFVAYILYRHHRPEIFAYAHHYLDVKWGAINTGVLIASSLSAAWAVRCAQLNQKRGLIFCLAFTIACAFGFLGIKYVEYTHKIHEGILFGRKFDPCISSGGAHLVTKKNQCHGTKASKCVSGDIDQYPNEPGWQVACKAFEVKGEARTELPVCQMTGGHGPPHPENAPCWEIQQNPNVCKPSPGDKVLPVAALVHYGDGKVRGKDVVIDLQCDPAPAHVPPPDPHAEKLQTPAFGAPLLVPSSRPTAHDLEIQASMGPPPEHTNMFFSIYFAMTGLHGLHVLFGIFIFIWLLVRAIKGHFTPDYFGPIDYAALYWHLVDLIWIFLFPLLYLIH